MIRHRKSVRLSAIAASIAASVLIGPGRSTGEETFSLSDKPERAGKTMLPKIDDPTVFRLLVGGFKGAEKKTASPATQPEQSAQAPHRNPFMGEHAETQGVSGEDAGGMLVIPSSHQTTTAQPAANPTPAMFSDDVVTSDARESVPMIAAETYQTPEGIGPLTSQTCLFQSLWGENNDEEIDQRYASRSPMFGLGPTVRTATDPAGERVIAGQVFTWASPALYHHPLIFEQVNLERYGLGPAPILQPAFSAAHFFANIATLPYHSVATPASERVYVLGHYRPGNCVPYQHHRVRRSWKGAVAQGLATAGTAWVLW